MQDVSIISFLDPWWHWTGNGPYLLLYNKTIVKELKQLLIIPSCISYPLPSWRHLPAAWQFSMRTSRLKLIWAIGRYQRLPSLPLRKFLLKGAWNHRMPRPADPQRYLFVPLHIQKLQCMQITYFSLDETTLHVPMNATSTLRRQRSCFARRLILFQLHA